MGIEEEVKRLQRELDQANAEVSRLTRSALRPYPILADPPLYVPWGMVEAAESTCRKNHNQSPQYLAERGGLSWKELAAVLTGCSLRDVRFMAQEHAKETIQRCVREYFTTRPVQPGDDLPHTTTAINALIQACNHQELGELILPRRAGPWYSEWVLWNSGGLNRTGWRFGRKAYDYSERDYTGDPICAVTEEADGRFSVQVLGEHIGAWPSAQEARDSADKKLAEEHVVLSER